MRIYSRLLLTVGFLTLIQILPQAQSGLDHCKKGRKLFPNLFKADNARSDTLDVLHIHLDLDMTKMDQDSIAAVARIDVKSKLNAVVQLNLDLLNLIVDSVKSGDALLGFTHIDELLSIDIPSLDIDDELEVTIYYQGSPQMDDSGWGGFYFQGDYAYNLGVGFDADPHTYGRAWFPCFDNFVERQTMTLAVLTNEGRSAYCGGMLEEIEMLDGDSAVYHWSLNQEVPSYLCSVAVSDYSPVVTQYENIEGNDIPIYLVAQAGDTVNVKSSFQDLEACLQIFEDRFGPYRWDRVGYAFVPFNAGAMEHATNIAYPLYAADGSTAFNSLMAHELSHHWWGDLITCRTQEDMWLNEGWASFCEFLFVEGLEGADAYMEAVRENHKDVLLHAHEDDGERLPVSGIGHEYTYGSHVYNKGADMAYNLRGYMGDDDFFEGTSSFLDDFAFNDASSHDLMTHLLGFTDADLEAFFDNWIYEPGFCAMGVDSFDFSFTDDQYKISIFTHQYLHYVPELYDGVNTTYTVFDEGGNRATGQIENYGQNTLGAFDIPFEPAHVIVNLEGELSMAMLSEEKMLGSTGFEQMNYAEFMVNVESIGAGDSLHVIAQNYWVGPQQDQQEFHLADDRFWRLYVNKPASAEAGGRIRYYGNSQAGNYFDPIFFESLAAEGMTEDSLLLVYRASPADPWIIHEDYELNVQGNTTNWQGLIDFANLRTGDYAWAYPTGKVGIHELEFNLSLYPNPAVDQITVDHGLTRTNLSVTDASGRIVYDEYVTGRRTIIDCSRWAPGMYSVQVGTTSVGVLVR